MTEFTIKGTSIYFNGWRVADMLSEASIPLTVYADFVTFVNTYESGMYQKGYAEGYGEGFEDGNKEGYALGVEDASAEALESRSKG